MSAQYIYATAPLGSLIRYSNGEQRPPERFRRKLAAWNNDNGTGRLVERYPGQVTDNYRSPAHFMLHLATYGSQGVIVMTVRRAYSVESPLNFEIVDTPKPGQVRVLTTFRGKDELRHLAADTRRLREVGVSTEHVTANLRGSQRGFERLDLLR